jgi:hypothetical protein
LPLLACGLLAACGDDSLSSPRRFWSMAELQREARVGLMPPGTCANPAGLPCNYFVKQRPASHDVLQFKLAFAEGQPMGYITTDFWADYDAIVLQPMYFLVTAWDEKLPGNNRLKNSDGATLAGPIFSIGPQSAFYSPFWSVFYVEVPPGTPAGKYTTTRQLFEDHLVMHQGLNRFASIGPADLDLPDATEIGVQFPAIGSYLADAAQLPLIAKYSAKLSGWFDGAAVSYVDFGTDGFSVDASRLVQDVPLFVFLHRSDVAGDDGKLVLLGASNVGGVGPLFSKARANVTVGGRPQFGALWRLYFVTVPATAQVFNPTPVPPGLEDRVLRVALDGACFAQLPSNPDACTWLDSQDRIEMAVGPGAISRTPFQPACPFVMYNRKAVPFQ